MDPLGFAFEHFDGIGRFRTTDQGQPVDATGNFIATRDIDGPFDGIEGLAERLLDSSEVEDCVISQYFRYAMRRGQEDADICVASPRCAKRSSTPTKIFAN